MKTTGKHTRLVAACLFLITGAWFALNTTAQNQFPPASLEPTVAIFLKIQGVDGASRSEGYEGWIDVESFSYALSRPTGALAAADGPREPANHRGLTLTKGVDEATPFLYLHGSSGEPIEEVVLAVARTTEDGHSAQEYRLRNAVVASVRTAVGPGALATEKVTLSYESIEWTYIKMDPATGRVVSEIATQWDRSANEKR